MSKKEKPVDVNYEDMIEEVHLRIDAIVELLNEKEILSKEAVQNKLEELYDKLNSTDH